MTDGFTVKVEGIGELIKNVKRYQFFKKEAIRQTLIKGGLKVESTAKETITEMDAVDTGNLKSRITTDASEAMQFIVKVGTNVFYGPYVEHGTRKMAARPFLYTAFFMMEGEIIRDIKVILKKDEGLKK